MPTRHLQIDGVQLLTIEKDGYINGTVEQKQRDGVYVKPVMGGDELYAVKRGMADKYKNFPVGTEIKVDGEWYKTTSTFKDWPDTVAGFLRRLFLPLGERP